MSIRKIWIAKNSELSEEQIKLCSSDIVLAALLKNRGIDTKEKIETFLNPLKSSLISPDVFNDIDKSVKRIKDAIDKQEKITVYGDFDADGITSTAVLYLTLKKIGANVDYYLPDRAIESHGLNTKALVKIISKKKSKLIITVDCGISNVQEVKFAKGFNTDVIITDHHEAPDILPEAYAILNPKAQNSLSPDLKIDDLNSLNYLAGVGVAFKLCCKLLETFHKEDFAYEILPLAAIGTIGDVVELIGENRSIVAIGLELIKNGKHKGIQKLLSSINIQDIKNLTAENIAFGIVPRLNATGRLEAPDTALNILISEDEEEIDNAIKTLNDLNSLRQKLCEDTYNSAKSMYEANKFENKKSIILFNEDWHLGIIGIAASKLVETYNKPAFLMTRDANSPNIIRCSSRSIEQLNIHAVLSEHKELFEGFGGHKMAAGFSFDENKISFENFKNILNKTIDEQLQDVDFSSVTVYADMELTPENITEKTIEHINLMQPFGQGNNQPLFIMNNLRLKEYKMMGQNSNHLKIFAEKDGQIIECIKWNMPDFSAPSGSPFDILFSLQLNEFNGNKTIQYIISDIHADFIKNENNEETIKILDHRKKDNIFNQVLDFILTTKKKTCIYIENPKLKKKIGDNEKIKSISFDIDNIPKNIQQLMFFDCPANKYDFKNIIASTGANIVHLMNFSNPDLNVNTIISTLSGMLKYSLNNLNGKFTANKLSKALMIDEETVLNILTIFDDNNMIDLEQISDEEFQITYLNAQELSKIKHHELYSSIEEKINEINNFKEFYFNADIDEIKEMCGLK